MNNIEKKLIKKVISTEDLNGVYTFRKNGKGVDKKTNEYINIQNKKDKPGLEVFVKASDKKEILHMPVIVTETGIEDVVYNDFYIDENADIEIIAGCGIHNNDCSTTSHNGVHSFYIKPGAKVKYIEKHYAEGKGTGKKILNPISNIYLGKGAIMEIETYQIEGVDSTDRKTFAKIEEDANLIVTEKILTSSNQSAKTSFEVELNGENSSTHLISRSVATEDSYQEFISKVVGNNKCYGHIECDAIIKDNAKVVAVPEIDANNVDANLIHEAVIGKIAGEQLIKLMTLGLNEKQAENQIIKGFLK